MTVLNSLLKHLYAANFCKWDGISWPLVCSDMAITMFKVLSGNVLHEITENEAGENLLQMFLFC